MSTNSATNDLVKSTLNKDSLMDCNAQELQQIGSKYPFFPFSHLFLAQKLKAGSAEAFEKQTQKASLYFFNPLQLHMLLHEKGKAVIEQQPKHTWEDEIPVHVQPRDISGSVPSESVISHEQMVDTATVSNTLSRETIEETQPSRYEPAAEAASDFTAGSVIEPPQDSNTAAADIVFDNSPDNTTPEETQPSRHEEAEERPSEINAEPATETSMAFTPEFSNGSHDRENNNGDADRPTEHIIEDTTPSGPIAKSGSFTIEPADSTAELSFQPYHTVDYFASQGIKVGDEEKPKDKFGQQLKSFTEWLRTLKKASTPSSPGQPAATQADQKVEQLAQYSLSDREVLTEAMAAVWEKQGNREKAIQIYSKLSLLNPSKSSYFAAKIEQLKNP